MKHIVKGQEPQDFANWKAQANANWQPTYCNLGGNPKQALKNGLMIDQGYICCYCERRLTDADSHIEHFQPQSTPTVDSLDFGNMLCSCNPEQGKRKPSHCGNLKDDWFNQALLVSPLDPNCESRFSFTGDGRIKTASHTDVAAAETIKRLGLDIPKLKALRAKVIEAFLDAGSGWQDFNQFVAIYLTKDAQGQYGEFWTTIRYLF